MKKLLLMFATAAFLVPFLGNAQVQLKSTEQGATLSFSKGDQQTAISFQENNLIEVTGSLAAQAILIAQPAANDGQSMENAASLLDLTPICDSSTGAMRYFLPVEGLSAIPGLVRVMPDGTECVDYASLVALLVGAVKELSEEVELLRNATAGIPTVASPGASLSQNCPNPAADSTAIPYSLPEGCQSASIRMTDLSGALVREWRLSPEPGSSQLCISTSDLQPGVYMYALALNGAVSAAKKMVVSH